MKSHSTEKSSYKEKWMHSVVSNWIKKVTINQKQQSVVIAFDETNKTELQYKSCSSGKENP